MLRSEGAEEAADELQVGVELFAGDQVFQIFEGRLAVLERGLGLGDGKAAQRLGEDELLARAHHAARA